MKRRLITSLGSVILALTLVACGGGTATTTTAPTTPDSTPVDSSVPATESKTDVDEVETTTPDTSEDETDEDVTESVTSPVEARDLGGRKVRMSAWWDLTPQPNTEQDEELIERYEQMEKDYNFEWEYVNIPWEDYQRSYITHSMSDDAIADIAIAEFNWIYPNLALNGFLADISQLKEFNFAQDKWNQGRIKLGTFDNKVYAWDIGRSFPVGVMFWNKSMFEREGVDPLYDDFFKGEWTWDKMIDIAKRLTKDTDGDGVTDQWGLSGTTLIQHFVYSNGGRSIDISDPTKPSFALLSDEAIEGFQALQDAANVDKVVELNPEGAEWDYSRTQFINGKVGMFVGQWWMVDSIKEGMQDEYGLVLFPKGPKADEYVSHNSALNMPTMPEAVKNKEDIAFLYNLRTEPLPDEDPEDWKIYFEDRVMDAQSIDVVEMLQDENLEIFDPTSCFSGVVELSYGYNYNIEHGNQTPQEAISAIADQAQSLIDTAMKQSPEDIVDNLTPDEDEGGDEGGDDAGDDAGDEGGDADDSDETEEETSTETE